MDPLTWISTLVLGFYNAPFETTYQTISQRRLQTLRQIAEKLVETRSIKHFWQCVMQGLKDNPYDVPFALRKFFTTGIKTKLRPSFSQRYCKTHTGTVNITSVV